MSNQVASGNTNTQNAGTSTPQTPPPPANLPKVSVTANIVNGFTPLTSHFVITISGGTLPYTWKIDFGNERTNWMISYISPAKNGFAHTYTNVGTYKVVARVIDYSANIVSSDPITITVYGQ